jgi:hypothetical protein
LIYRYWPHHRHQGLPTILHCFLLSVPGPALIHPECVRATHSSSNYRLTPYCPSASAPASASATASSGFLIRLPPQAPSSSNQLHHRLSPPGLPHSLIYLSIWLLHPSSTQPATTNALLTFATRSLPSLKPPPPCRPVWG